MACDICGGHVSPQQVSYPAQVKGKFVIVENVPAKVCDQCGEKLFAADTVEKLQKTVWEQKSPVRILQTPVFDFPNSA